MSLYFERLKIFNWWTSQKHILFWVNVWTPWKLILINAIQPNTLPKWGPICLHLSGNGIGPTNRKFYFLMCLNGPKETKRVNVSSDVNSSFTLTIYNKCLILYPFHLKSFILLFYTNHPNTCKITFYLSYFNPILLNLRIMWYFLHSCSIPPTYR